MLQESAKAAKHEKILEQVVFLSNSEDVSFGTIKEAIGEMAAIGHDEATLIVYKHRKNCVTRGTPDTYHRKPTYSNVIPLPSVKLVRRGFVFGFLC